MEKTKPKKLEKTNNTPSVLLVGIPGPGLIGTLSVTYIIHSLKMELVGEIDNPDLSSIMFIENGELLGPVRLYKKGTLYAVISDVPIDYELAHGFTESIIEFSKRNNINSIIVFSGIHVPERNLSNLKTYGLVTKPNLEKTLYENEIPKFLTGMITGPDATILSILKNSSIPAMVLYTECNFFFPDPESAMQAIKTISRMLKIEIELTEFKDQIDFLRLHNRQLMEETLSVLQQEKEQPTVPPQIYK